MTYQFASLMVKAFLCPPPKNLGAQKHQNFGFRALIANISGLEQDIVDRKTALKLQSLPKFGELWSTNGEK